MKTANLFLSVSLAFGLLGGCSKSDPAEKMVTMMEDLGSAIDKSGEDCGKMASAVEGVMSKYDLKAMKADAEKMKSNKEDAKKMEEKYGPRMQKVMPKLMGMMKCSEDPKMKAVNEKLKDVM